MMALMVFKSAISKISRLVTVAVEIQGLCYAKTARYQPRESELTKRFEPVTISIPANWRGSPKLYLQDVSISV